METKTETSTPKYKKECFSKYDRTFYARPFTIIIAEIPMIINTESIPKIMPTINDYRTKTFTISYQKQEAEKVMGMENELMEYFGYNRSQLHKTLVRDAYRQLRML